MARAKAHLASFESKGSHAPATDIPAKVMSYEEVFQVLIPQVHHPWWGPAPEARRAAGSTPRPRAVDGVPLAHGLPGEPNDGVLLSDLKRTGSGYEISIVGKGDRPGILRDVPVDLINRIRAHFKHEGQVYLFESPNGGKGRGA